MEKDYIDLYTLQTQIQQGIEEMFPSSIWVKAEVSSCNVKGGHCYLELSQSDDNKLIAKVRAIIWRFKFNELSSFFQAATGAPIQPGIQILVRCKVSMDPLYGLSLIIDDIDPEYTMGALEMEKQKTIEKLQKLGLFEKQKNLELAPIPRRLAVISSIDAAGYGDFTKHLSCNDYGYVFEVKLFQATMQGVSAPSSIVQAFKKIESEKSGFDAVLLLRGGGSVLDLVCFDDYAIASSIANCPYPVFTAIGHDRDYHVADMIAYKYVKTPTALADEFINAYISVEETVNEYSARITRAVSGKISLLRSKVDSYEIRIKSSLSARLRTENVRLEMYEAKILSSDPRKLLERGYVLALNADGVVMKTSKGAAIGDKLSVLFSDGKLDCKVEKIV